MIKQLYRFLHPGFQNLFLEYKVQFRPRYGHGKPPHPQLARLLEEGRPGYARWLEEVKQWRERFWEIKPSGRERDPVQPVWNNGYLPGLDIMMLYAVLARRRPGRYVEVGSGNSTKVAYKVKTDLGLDMRIESIDPAPREEIDRLANVVLRIPFEEADLRTILDLEAGDVLFIDNSHRILPNSDALVFFLDVLPRLQKGVIVQMHDVYLPYDYPPFMCERFYSEQYGLAINLLANPRRYRVLMPNYFVSEDAELSALLAPVWDHPNLHGVERHGGSFWLEIGD